MIVPFHSYIAISSESYTIISLCRAGGKRIRKLTFNPYEHDPSPIPFSPCSNSERRRKLLGTKTKVSIGHVDNDNRKLK